MDVARIVNTFLDGRVVTIDEENGESRKRQLDVYFDQAEAATGDWTRIHEPHMKGAEAFICICTPGVFSDLGPNDWVHTELRWWVQNRERAPIIVEAIGNQGRWVPLSIQSRWPKAQRVQINASNWMQIEAAEQEEIVNRIVAGIATSSETYLEKELIRQNKTIARQRRLTRALIASLCAVVLVAGLAVLQWNRAIAAKDKTAKALGVATDLIKRINVGDNQPAGTRAVRRVCNRANIVTSELANPETTDVERLVLLGEFWELYWGDMNLVELKQIIQDRPELASGQLMDHTEPLDRSPIEKAMVKFGEIILEYGRSVTHDEFPYEDLEIKADDVEKECESFLTSE